VHVLVPVEAVQEMVETHGLDQDADAIRRLDAPAHSAATASAAGTESDSFGGSTEDFEEHVRTNVYTGYHAQPVHIAAEHGHSEVVAELLDHGADVDSMSMGLTPLHLTGKEYLLPSIVTRCTCIYTKTVLLLCFSVEKQTRDHESASGREC
jgi:hypothetical protein